ncbi:MAG: pyridoxine 5'-phosphate synthase [Gammaproteobacteria bacterium]
MTKLSVNINKVALLRNSRGRNYPDVAAFAARCLELGAHGITLHPRPDQRHARYSDVAILRQICRAHGGELNVEGFPDRPLLDAVLDARPDQCTLVPDQPGQLTSDHGWDARAEASRLRPVIAELRGAGVRVSLFMDADYPDFDAARAVGADRIELYTDPYAASFHRPDNAAVLQQYREAARRANAAGLGVNAGHDLNLENLASFLQIPNILEVSIGHALTVECLEYGVATVLSRYVAILGGRAM